MFNRFRRFPKILNNFEIVFKKFENNLRKFENIYLKIKKTLQTFGTNSVNIRPY